jgi:enoyl-CoA hydratase
LTESDLILKKSGRVWVASLNRPEVLNALRKETLLALEGALDELAATPPGNGLIITGEGKAFCAGGDIKEMNQMTEADAKGFAQLAHRVMDKIRSVEKPIMAAVHGPALGAGFDLATACDLIVASEESTFGSPTLRLGIITPFGGVRRLPKMIGLNRAKQLFFTGETIDAQRARDLGIVSAVVAREQLMSETTALAERVLEKAPIALGFTKRLANLSYADSSADLAQLEVDLYAKCFETSDKAEGMRAFMEKRKAVFRGQ